MGITAIGEKKCINVYADKKSKGSYLLKNETTLSDSGGDGGIRTKRSVLQILKNEEV